MAADPWDVLKDGLGFAGALLAAIPWFRDFAGRRLLSDVRRVPGRGARARAFLDAVQARLRERQEQPRAGDLALQLGGLLLIALAFGLSAARGLFGLLG